MLAIGFDAFDFAFGQGGRTVARADKASNTLSSADSQPGVVSDDHPDKHIAGEDFFIDGGFFAFTDLYFLLSRNEDFKDLVSEVHGMSPLFESGGSVGFVARVSMDHIPFSRGRGVFSDDDVVGTFDFSPCFFGW